MVIMDYRTNILIISICFFNIFFKQPFEPIPIYRTSASITSAIYAISSVLCASVIFVIAVILKFRESRLIRSENLKYKYFTCYSLFLSVFTNNCCFHPITKYWINILCNQSRRNERRLLAASNFYCDPFGWNSGLSSGQRYKHTNI